MIEYPTRRPDHHVNPGSDGIDLGPYRLPSVNSLQSELASLADLFELHRDLDRQLPSRSEHQGLRLR